MLSEFVAYLRLGVGHIADLKGSDHILFLVALTAGYATAQWRSLLLLVTAFTLGHSITLAIATLGLVQVSARLVEPLIAVTIILAGVLGLWRIVQRKPHSAASRPLYALAGLFGLIHGLGFSSFLRAMLGAEEQITWPLFSFNVGLELGQLAIVGVIVVAGIACCDFGKLPRRVWSASLSAIAVLSGVALLVQRL